MRPKNWESFQHYKDRRPPWIRLHRSLVDNMDFWNLSGIAVRSLIILWLVASENVNGRITDDIGVIAFRLRTSTDRAKKIVKELKDAGFIEDFTEQPATQSAAELNGFGSRYISDKVKSEVWKRDDGKCRDCGAKKDIEYDRVIPVSIGGKSTADNIQLLCRPCNRKKRNKLRKQAEQFATQGADNYSALRTPEAEAEAEAEQSRGAETDAPPLSPENTAWESDPADNIPDGLGSIQYAMFVLQECAIPASYALKVKTADTIELLAREENCAMSEATRRLLGRMRAAAKAGTVKWQFWLEDGGWKQADPVGVSTEGWE